MMSTEKIDLDDEIRRMAADSRPDLSEHPEPDKLLAYHEGELSEEDADLIQEHLVHCDECAQTVLDFAAFPNLEPPDESLRLSRSQVREQWQELEAKVAELRRPLWKRHEVALALAALFCAATIGLGVWVAQLRQEIDALEGPKSDIYLIADLRPGGTVTRGSGGRAEQVPRWAREIFLLLNGAPDGEYGGHEVEVRSVEGRMIVRAQPVHRNPEGNFPMVLPRALLPDGEYVVELFGLRVGSPRVSLAEYPLVIDSP